MNLSELLVLLKEARVLDDRITAREVCTMFVKVRKRVSKSVSESVSRCIRRGGELWSCVPCQQLNMTFYLLTTHLLTYSR